MKRFIEGVERHQVMLLPDCLDNYIDDEITEDSVFEYLESQSEQATCSTAGTPRNILKHTSQTLPLVCRA